MKRKDWRTKKLKKNIYGKFLKRRRIFFLRKLYLRKNLVLVKKNLIMHYFFFDKLLNSIKISKKSVVKNFCNFEFNLSYFLIFPGYFFKKKVFNQHISFKKLMLDLNLAYFYINTFKSEIKNYFFKGNNYLLTEKNGGFCNLGNITKNLISDENKFLVSIKHEKKKNNFLYENLNFFFNFNITIIQNIEIYKIMLILFLQKIYVK